MQTYTNYYGIRPGTKKYGMIVEKNIREMLCVMAGLEAGASLEDVSLKTAAETYLIRYGMDEGTLKLLEEKLR